MTFSITLVSFSMAGTVLVAQQFSRRAPALVGDFRFFSVPSVFKPLFAHWGYSTVTSVQTGLQRGTFSLPNSWPSLLPFDRTNLATQTQFWFRIQQPSLTQPILTSQSIRYATRNSGGSGHSLSSKRGNSPTEVRSARFAHSSERWRENTAGTHREEEGIDSEKRQDVIPGPSAQLGPSAGSMHRENRQERRNAEGFGQGSGLGEKVEREGSRQTETYSAIGANHREPNNQTENSDGMPPGTGDEGHLTTLSVRETLAATNGVQSRVAPPSRAQSQEAKKGPPRRDKPYRPARGEKPLCYHFTQGLCKNGDKESHLEKYSHTYPDLPVRPSDLTKVRRQPFDFYLVLDLEGRVEILEFPVVLLDVKTLQPLDRFHRFVRPAKMTLERQDSYIRGKYGRWGLDSVWNATAIPFTAVLEQFETWMEAHGLWQRGHEGPMERAAFVTCGNWDVKTKIPEQCVDSAIELPPYFKEWVNLKDVYYNHYNRKPSGMRYMLESLKIPLRGTHHLGLDDAHNITRILQRMLAHQAVVKVTGRRTGPGPSDVKWTYGRRVK